jgi:hypothetical protein
MKMRVAAVLGVICLTAAGCGPQRGLRVEHMDGSGNSAVGLIHIASGTTMPGIPDALAADGGTIWVSVYGPRVSIVQPLATRTAQTGGFIESPFRSDLPLAIATTRGRLWILVQPPQGPARLLDVKTHERDALEVVRYARLGWSPRATRRRALSFPRSTKIAGATTSAVWLTADAGTHHVLWRLDAQSSELSRFELASHGTPGIIVTPRGVYVLLRTRLASMVVIQKRNSAGRVIRQSPPFRLRGAFQPGPLAACRDELYGWTRTPQGAELFRAEAHGNGAIYSQPLSPRVNSANPPTVTAMTLDNRCRDVWIGTINEEAGLILRLRASSLAVTGRVNTAYVRTLLWTRGSLWASDLEHHAVLNVR